LIDPFSIYVWILGYKLHPHSILTFLIAIYLCTVLLAPRPLHIRLMISMAVCMGEYYFGEIGIGFLCGRFVDVNSWYGGLTLYTLVLVGIVSVLSIMNDKYHFYAPNWRLVGLGALILVMLVSILWFSGWFELYIAWAGRSVPVELHHWLFDFSTPQKGDPHNWLLAMAQLVLFLMWLPLIGNKHNVKEDVEK